jgi:hypothetical protein
MVTLLAFIVLTGGTAVALNGQNTVQSDDLGPGAQVKAADVADNAVNSADVVNNSLKAADVAESSLGKVPSATQADLLSGRTASQLEGARAYAVSGSDFCSGTPPTFCSTPRSKGVAYVVRIGVGHYCVGVNGISAADPSSVALVSMPGDESPDYAASWHLTNAGCVSREFEITTNDTHGRTSYPPFTIVVP